MPDTFKVTDQPEFKERVAEAEAANRTARVDVADAKDQSEAVTIGDFWAYMQTHTYIYAPTHAMWPAASVNARIPAIAVTNPDGSPKLDEDGKPIKLSASAWLDRNRPVEHMTWSPGDPRIIKDRMPMLEGGWIHRDGATTFNLYNPPIVKPGDPRAAQLWIDHIYLVYPDDAEHIIDWFAHRVQYPGRKINHALVLGGDQGIGKDSIIAPVRYAVGPWNVQEADPGAIMGRFNGFLRSIILRINEAHDLGDTDRFKLYDHLKTIEAAPPEFLRVDEKHTREYPIVNCCGVVITTNHKTDGVYLPPDDRRHFVAWSDLTKEDARFAGDYWNRLHDYYEREGNRAVAAYLQQRDISKFDPNAPPPKTAAFWAIVDAGCAPEEREIADALDALGCPAAITLFQLRRIAEETNGDLADWLKEHRNRRAIPHRLEKCGYVPVRNPDSPTQGDWKVGSKRQVIYARKELSERDRFTAARRISDLGRAAP